MQNQFITHSDHLLKIIWDVTEIPYMTFRRKKQLKKQWIGVVEFLQDYYGFWWSINDDSSHAWLVW